MWTSKYGEKEKTPGEDNRNVEVGKDMGKKVHEIKKKQCSIQTFV